VPKLLTDAELDLMEVLWRCGAQSARQAHGELTDTRALTTVSTILRILADKGFVQVQAQGRAHSYAPAITRAGYRRRQVKHVIGTLFEGSASALVRELVQDGELDADELARLQQTLLDGEE
jgi:predicted transcriptional regulator